MLYLHNFRTQLSLKAPAPQLQDSWLSNNFKCCWVPPSPSAQMNRQGRAQSPGSHKRARNHRAWESWLLRFQLCGTLPRSPQSTRGICQVFRDLLRHPACQGYPRATNLTARQEPWNQAWSLSEPIPCLCRKSLKWMLLQNILVSMNLPFLMENCCVRKFPASSSL